jgi:ppGpp synthetase/RelA/SpoT-type nucleotidyltranferase
MFSNSQVDKLGRELRDGQVNEENLRRLEMFRSEFVEAYTYVEDVLVRKLRITVTGRPSKSTVAIVDKLRRETARLSQIQDIAGCRVVVPDIASQNKLLDLLVLMLGGADIDDKRETPTHGYRAIHIVTKHNGRPVEIQLRTRSQHAWAEISEKMADAFGQSIKYGQGEPWVLDFLSNLSNVTSKIETIRYKKKTLLKQIKYSERLSAQARLNFQEKEAFAELKGLFSRTQKQAVE